MPRVLVIGATGLIGSHVAAALNGAGHEVTGVARHVGSATRRMPRMRWLQLDLARASRNDWGRHLAGVDAVVNCAGALQSGPDDDLAGTHERGLAALVAACEAAGVRRLVHFSAMGVDRTTPSDFSRTKLAGDRILMASGLDWVILRPSVVLGVAVYGASALIRGLAALPLLPVMPGTAPLQPVTLDDVVATVALFLNRDAPARVAVDLAGPDRFSFTGLVQLFRGWLGHAPAREIALPTWLADFLYRLGDLAGLLGWRPPVRSTARREIARGAVGDTAEWTRLTGIAPRSVPAMLNAHPASVQEGWFAGLYLLKPLVLASLALFWIGSGIVSLGPGYSRGIAMMQQTGALAPLAVIGGGLADLLVGLGIAVRRTAGSALVAGIAVALFYALAGTFLTPWLWLDPLAPLLKIAPVIALHLVALATLRER